MGTAEGAPPRRRVRWPRRLRGWGGVGAMAAACAMALTAMLLPLTTHGPRTDRGASHQGPATQARQALAPGSCASPEASLAPSAAAGPAVRRIQRHGYLIVGVDQNSYRWGYLDPETGQFAGFDIDLVRAIAKDLLGPNPRIIFRTVPTSQRIKEIQQGQVDMVVRTMTINCDRAHQVAFSAAYFETGQQLLVPKTGTTITGFNNSLNRKRVCAANSSTALQLLQSQPHGSRIVQVPNQLDCLVLLQLGQADAVLNDGALAAGQAAQDPQVHVIGQPLTHEAYGVAMNLADTDLVRRVNKVLAAYESGGAGSEWMRAYEKWLSPYLPGVTGPPAPAYRN